MWFADQGAAFFVVHLSLAMSYSRTRSFLPPWLPPIRYSFPFATAFQYSSSGAGTGANFGCASQRPGDCAATVNVASTMDAAIAANVVQVIRISLHSFARCRA